MNDVAIALRSTRAVNESVHLFTTMSEAEKVNLLDRLAGQAVYGDDGHIRVIMSTSEMAVSDETVAPAVSVPAVLSGIAFTTEFGYDYGDERGMLTFDFADKSCIEVVSENPRNGGPLTTYLEVTLADGESFRLTVIGDDVDDSEVLCESDHWSDSPASCREVGLWAAAVLARAQLAESAVRFAAKDATHQYIEAIAIEEPK